MISLLAGCPGAQDPPPERDEHVRAAPTDDPRSEFESIAASLHQATDGFYEQGVPQRLRQEREAAAGDQAVWL